MVIDALESTAVRALVRYPTLPCVAEPVANRSRALHCGGNPLNRPTTAWRKERILYARRTYTMSILRK
jgi:hypothetical protein